MKGGPVDRARHLLAAGRPDDALRELAEALSNDPQDAEAHGLRALALADLDRFDAALESAQRAKGADPESPFGHAVESSVLLRMGKGRRALESALEARSLDPDDPDLYDAVASAYVVLSRWRDGLEAAEQGLELDPRDTRLTNLRALCLRQLGERDEADVAIAGALREDPDNAWTHQNLGYTHLAAGRYEDAIRAFRESLRLDPTDEASRVGLATAIKARFPLYRPIVAWEMFCSRLSERFGILMIVGFLLLHRWIQSALPEGSVLGTVLLVGYGSFVWMSWAGSALFDVMLLARPSVRDVLDRSEKLAACGVLGCLVLAGVSLVNAFASGSIFGSFIALAFAFAAIPVSGWVKLPNGRARLAGVGVAIAAVGFAVAALVFDSMALAAVDGRFDQATTEGYTAEEVARIRGLNERTNTAATISLFVSVGSTWLLTALGFVPERKGGTGERRRPR